MNFLFLYVACIFYCKLAAGLQCGTGVDLNAPLLSNYDVWNTEECPRNSSSLCIRMEATLFYLDFIEASATFGKCVIPSLCELPCEEILVDLLTLIEGSEDPFLTGRRPAVINCRHVCCNGNNCNEYSTDEILRQQSAVSMVTTSTTRKETISYSTTTSMTTRSTSHAMTSSTRSSTSYPTYENYEAEEESSTEGNFDIEETLACLEGYEIESTIPSLSDRSWDVNSCASFNSTSCLRLEAVILVFEAFEVGITLGMCADYSKCAQSCATALQEARLTVVEAHSEPLINSCNVVCCEKNLCNSNNISDIRTSTYSVSSTTISSISSSSAPSYTAGSTSHENGQPEEMNKPTNVMYIEVLFSILFFIYARILLLLFVGL